MKVDEVVNVAYKKCLEEKRKQEVAIPFNNVIDRTANYTGMSKEIIQNLSKIQHHENFVECVKSFPLEKRIDIYHSQKELYRSISVSNTTVLADEKNEDYKKILAWMGYETKTFSRYSEPLLVEIPAEAFKRFQYLKHIKHFRSSNQLIFYIDETIIEETLSFKKLWMIGEDSSVLTDSVVFYHIIADDFKTGLFCNKLSYEDYLKWLNETVLPNLSPGSVVVFNESPFTEQGAYRGHVSKNDSKGKILNLLKQNNIPCSETMHKSELYQLAKTYLKPKQQGSLVEIVEAHGHKILIKPTTLFDLTPNNLLWMKAQQFIQQKLERQTELKTLISLFWNKMNEVSPWNSMIYNIEQTEKKLLDIEIDTDKYLSMLF